MADAVPGLMGTRTVGMSSSAARRFACAGAGATEGHEDEVPRVVSALHRNPPQRADHGVVGDLHDAEGHLDHVQAERVGAPLLDGMPGRRLVKPHLAAEEVIRIEPAEDEVRVGDGGARSLLSRSRRGAGSAPALCGPTRSTPPESTQAMEPPPAPISTRSMTGVRMG